MDEQGQAYLLMCDSFCLLTILPISAINIIVAVKRRHTCDLETATSAVEGSHLAGNMTITQWFTYAVVV